MTTPASAAPQIPVSWGELIDRITILEIKSERLRAEEALANVRRELALLQRLAAPILETHQVVGETKMQLRVVNEKLWDVEDRLREMESARDLGSKFVELARSVYKNNDQRAALKRRINDAVPCGIVEEKSYAGAGTQP